MERHQVRSRIEKIASALESGLIERETPIRLALLSALSGEHILLLGQHGTAKSALARKLHLALSEGHYFERLLTRFSVPEELFGPLSIKAIENDQYKRLTDRYLPSASIAFIDEIFKANSAILNSLLTLLNERVFDNGDSRVEVPLVSVIGASNELPEEENLAAIYDRFLCRYQVQPISDDNFAELLRLEEPDATQPKDIEPLTINELAEIQSLAEKVKLSDGVLTLLENLRTYSREKGLYISDRRWRKTVKFLKVAAWTNGHDELSVWDCWLLQHCLWDRPEEQPLISEWYRRHLGVGSGFNPERLEKLVSTWEGLVAGDANSSVQQQDSEGNLLYETEEGEVTRSKSFRRMIDRSGQPLYLSPPDQDDRSNGGLGYTAGELTSQFFDDRYQQCHIGGKWLHIDNYLSDSSNRLVVERENLPLMEPKQHEQSYIQGRLSEVETLRSDVSRLAARLAEQIVSLDSEIGEHLWIDHQFILEAAESLGLAKQKANQLEHRLTQVAEQYSRLPQADN